MITPVSQRRSILSVLAFAVALTLLCATSPSALAAETLYGGLGGHNNGDSTNDGALGIVSQTTGAVSIVGHPAGVVRLSGVAYDTATNTLYGSTLFPGGGFPPPTGPRASNLITLDRNSGALLTSTPVTAGAFQLSLADIAFQPGTNTLFGITNPDGAGVGPGNLYTINLTTGVATLVGNTGLFFDTIAFAPNGTLYLAGEQLGMMGPDASTDQLDTIDPTNAMILSTVKTSDFFGALAIRSDGTIFGGNGDQHTLFTVNPTTGAETLVGDTGSNFVGGLVFVTPETGSSLGFLVIALIAVAGARRHFAGASALDVEKHAADQSI